MRSRSEAVSSKAEGREQEGKCVKEFRKNGVKQCLSKCSCREEKKVSRLVAGKRMG